MAKYNTVGGLCGGEGAMAWLSTVLWLESWLWGG